MLDINFRIFVDSFCKSSVILTAECLGVSYINLIGFYLNNILSCDIYWFPLIIKSTQLDSVLPVTYLIMFEHSYVHVTIKLIFHYVTHYSSRTLTWT